MPGGADDTRPGTQDDEVRLAVPADPEYLRLARVTASGLASRGGFSLDEVEDLRLALDELCFWLVGTEGRRGRIALRYALGAHELVVEGTGHFDAPVAPRPLDGWSERILEALVDEHHLWPDADIPRFRLRKRSGAAP